jgi:hypothetical protein
MRDPDLQDLAERLKQLSNGEMVAVLQEVFTHKRPEPDNMEEVGNLAYRFFLGVAYAELAEITDEQLVWKQRQNQPNVEIEAIAYLDYDCYDIEFYRGDEFCQMGFCSNCGITLNSPMKNARCPICNASVYLS